MPPMGLVIYQFWGASMAAVGVLCWLLRDTSGTKESKALWGALAVLNATNAVLAVRGQAAGANVSGWAMVLLYSFFALTFLFVTIRSIRQ